MRGGLTRGLRRWFISTCRNASARTEVVEWSIYTQPT
jgi:hypothetical protein